MLSFTHAEAAKLNYFCTCQVNKSGLEFFGFLGKTLRPVSCHSSCIPPFPGSHGNLSAKAYPPPPRPSSIPRRHSAKSAAGHLSPLVGGLGAHMAPIPLPRASVVMGMQITSTISPSHQRLLSRPQPISPLKGFYFPHANQTMGWI